MKKVCSLSAFLCLVTLVACDRSNKKTEAADIALTERQDQEHSAENKELQQKIPVGNFQPASTDSSPIQNLPVPIANPDWDKKIVKTASVKIEVKDFKKYTETLHKAVRQHGGYIASEVQSLSDERSENIISIKVPVSNFETLMNELPAEDSKLLERNITTEDVTGQIVDTRSRLEAKKQMRLKYLGFLKQSKNMEESLQVQGEINIIQEEIEAATGRVNALSHQSSMSTINLTFFQPAIGYIPADSSPSFSVRIANAFKAGTGWIADIFVALMSIWPLILFILLIIFGLKKRNKHFKPAPVNTQA